jgi:hypothetical protein
MSITSARVTYHIDAFFAPAQTFKRKQRGGAKRFTVLTPEQAARLFSELPADLLPMVPFALSTALRDANGVRSCHLR